jgi:hypothetical protein
MAVEKFDLYAGLMKTSEANSEAVSFLALEHVISGMLKIAEYNEGDIRNIPSFDMVEKILLRYQEIFGPQKLLSDYDNNQEITTLGEKLIQFKNEYETFKSDNFSTASIDNLKKLIDMYNSESYNAKNNLFIRMIFSEKKNNITKLLLPPLLITQTLSNNEHEHTQANSENRNMLTGAFKAISNSVDLKAQAKIFNNNNIAKKQQSPPNTDLSKNNSLILSSVRSDPSDNENDNNNNQTIEDEQLTSPFTPNNNIHNNNPINTTPTSSQPLNSMPSTQVRPSSIRTLVGEWCNRQAAVNRLFLGVLFRFAANKILGNRYQLSNSNSTPDNSLDTITANHSNNSSSKLSEIEVKFPVNTAVENNSKPNNNNNTAPTIQQEENASPKSPSLPPNAPRKKL